MRFYEIDTPIGPQLVTSKTGLKNPKLVEVPTDSKGLLEYINKLLAACVPVRENDAEQNVLEAPIAPVQEPAPVDPDGTPRRSFDSQPKWGALRSLAIMDAPDGTIPDAVAREIAEAKGYVLARYAEAVSVRYADLAKGPTHGKKG